MKSKNKQELIELSLEMRNKRISMVMEQEFNTVIRHLDNISKIKGDVVECGCWKGGFSIFLGHAFPEKTLWVADSFEGFQPLETAKYKYNAERHVPAYGLGSPGTEDDFTLERVKQRFEEYQLTGTRIKYLKGFVKDSLPTSGIDKIALLRIDVDAYSATKEVLDELYDKVQPGGYIIFDDSCLYESRDAIRDFFMERKLPSIVMHPELDIELDVNSTYIPTNSGLPAGCYIVKN